LQNAEYGRIKDDGTSEMRRPERKIRNDETIEAMLKQMPVGRIATVNRKGFPVIKPVNYIYWDGKLYIHSSTKGEKVEDIRRGSPVCFEIDEPLAYVAATGPACMGNYYYRSIIVKGKAGFINHRNKKLIILEKLMEKYQPEGGYEGISERVLNKTTVIEIQIEEIMGKESLG
jgi:nitroimidazol reductase NimA-like FMN-containing flavoprotein (pyridoxamine 5'-phosphate oxidase superfamily)